MKKKKKLPEKTLKSIIRIKYVFYIINHIHLFSIFTLINKISVTGVQWPREYDQRMSILNLYKKKVKPELLLFY